MKALLRKLLFLSLGDQTKTEKLQLEECSMVAASQKVLKKLARSLLRLQMLKKSMLYWLKKPAWTKLYQEKGYAFEALSPEGDWFSKAEDNKYKRSQRRL